MEEVPEGKSERLKVFDGGGGEIGACLRLGEQKVQKLQKLQNLGGMFTQDGVVEAEVLRCCYSWKSKKCDIECVNRQMCEGLPDVMV